MNDRGKFEAWLEEDTTMGLDDEVTEFAWYVWKAATAESAARIAELEKDRDEWKDATISANTRFKIAEDRVAELEKKLNNPVYLGLTKDMNWISCSHRDYKKLPENIRMIAYANTGDKP